MKFIKIQTTGSATKPLSETEKSLLKTRNKGRNDMANKKPWTDGQTWRRLKRTAIVVFENLLGLLAEQFFKVHFCCLYLALWLTNWPLGIAGVSLQKL